MQLAPLNSSRNCVDLCGVVSGGITKAPGRIDLMYCTNERFVYSAGVNI